MPTNKKTPPSRLKMGVPHSTHSLRHPGCPHHRGP